MTQHETLKPAAQVRAGTVLFANDAPISVLAGPCQMESRAHALEMAAGLSEVAKALGFGLVYKSSFDKANRTSLSGRRGIGLEAALPVFAEIRERFGLPIVSFIDIMGAYPGIEGEERSVAEAIARNLAEMSLFKVPIVVAVIGEGGSGGAIGIGVGDRVIMLENAWYSVISPENCSTILWRSWDQKARAAEAMKLTASDMLGQGLIDGIIQEPVGGAHANWDEIFANVKGEILKQVAILKPMDANVRVTKRIDKFCKMGVVIE